MDILTVWPHTFSRIYRHHRLGPLRCTTTRIRANSLTLKWGRMHAVADNAKGFTPNTMLLWQGNTQRIVLRLYHLHPPSCNSAITGLIEQTTAQQSLFESSEWNRSSRSVRWAETTCGWIVSSVHLLLMGLCGEMSHFAHINSGWRWFCETHG